MNRRGFLAFMASTLVLDPERLLWVPGKKTISIPAQRKVLVVRRFLLDGKVYEIAPEGL